MKMGTTIKTTWKVIEKFTKENAPTIVMAIGVGMMVGGTVTAVASTTKAVRRVDEENARLTADGQRPLRKQEIVSTCWKLYVPSILLTVGGATCVVAANHMNLTRLAAVGAVAKLNEDKLKEYKAAVTKALDEKDHKKVKEEVAKGQIAACPPPESVMSIPGYGAGMMLCHDGATGQYFWSSKQKVESAVNEVNRQLNCGDRVRLSMFLEELGCDSDVASADMLGWETDINGLAKRPLEVDYEYIEGPNGQPVLHLEYEVSDLLPF